MGCIIYEAYFPNFLFIGLITLTSIVLHINSVVIHIISVILHITSVVLQYADKSFREKQIYKCTPILILAFILEKITKNPGPGPGRDEPDPGPGRDNDSVLVLVPVPAGIEVIPDRSRPG